MDCEKDCHVLDWIKGKKDQEPVVSNECLTCVVFEYRIRQQMTKLLPDDQFNKESKKYIEGDS